MVDAVERAREAALRILERKRRTRRELEQRLARAGHPGEAVREAIERLSRVGLVDDLEYARAYLSERLGKRAVGERLLRQELRARGVPVEEIDQAFADLARAAGEAPESASEVARARRAAAELARRYARLEPAERRRRLLAALARRGFEYATASEALEECERE